LVFPTFKGHDGIRQPLSEIIVPILDRPLGKVMGTIDVESERANAFSASDQHLLEECARAALPLWIPG
jgi:putative methionine-R-sulfoxide reductase with GAF domain